MERELDQLLNAALELGRAKNFDLAREKCESALKHATTGVQKAEILVTKAMVEDLAKEKTAQIGFLQQALRYDPESRRALYSMMVALIQIGNFKQSTEFANQLLNVDRSYENKPFTWSAYFHRGYAEFRLSRHQAAIESLSQCPDGYRDWLPGGVTIKEDLLAKIRSGLKI